MADINKLVALVVQAKDQASAVLKGSEKAIKNYDKTVSASAKNSAAAGNSAASAGKGFDKFGNSAASAGKKVSAAANSSKKSLKDINKAWDVLGTKSTKAYTRELQRMDAAFSRIKNSGKASAKDIARAHRALLAQQKKLRQEVHETASEYKSLGSVVGSLIGSLAAIAASAGIVITPIVETAKFNKSMADVKAVLGDVTENEFAQLNEVARDLGATTSFSAQQAAEGLQFLAMAGFSAVEAIEALPGVLNLAQAGNLGLGEAADIASNILTGMGLEVSELDRVNDVLVQGFTSTNTSLSELGSAFSYVAPIAASFGLSVEQTTTALGMLSNAGIKASMAGTSLRGILTKLANPSANGAAAMAEIAKRIGQTSLEITDANGKFLDFGHIIRQFEKAGLTASEAITILGQRAGPGLAALVSQGADKFDELNTKMLSSAGRTDEIAKIMRDTLVGDFKSAQSAVSELALAIGDQLVPAARAVVSWFGSMVTAVSGLIKDYPFLTKLVIGLGIAIAGLATAISTIGIAKNLRPLFALQWSAGVTGVKAFTSAIVGGFAKAKVAVTAFAASNPVLLALTVALTAAAAAWVIFGGSATSSAKKHQESADAIGKTRTALRDQIVELEKIQKILSEEDAGSSKFIAAQERMVEILPGANSYIDEQGRLLARVDGDGEAAAKGLKKYVDELKKAEKLQFADQLEATQQAMTSASEGARDYAAMLQKVYGRGSGTQITGMQKFNKALDSSVGFYRKNVNAHKELREAYKKSGREMNTLLTQAHNSGMSIEELTETLANNAVGTKDSEAILKKYTKILDESAEAKRKLIEKTREYGATDKEIAELQKKTADELKQELEDLNKESKKYGKSLSEQNKIVSESLKTLEKDYEELNKAAKSRADSELQAIEVVKQARLGGLRGQTEGRRAAAETRIIRDAYRSRIAALQNYTKESEALFRGEEETRRGLADQGAGDPTQVESDILQKRKAFYTETVASYRSMIDQMISEENRHLDAIKKIEDEKKNLKSSTEDKIRALRRNGLTEEEAYQDKLKQIDEKQSAAKRALAEGDYAEAKRLNEQARSLAESSIRSEGGDVTEAQAGQSIQKTISELKQSEAIGQQILDQMAADHQAAAEGIAAERGTLQSGLQVAEQKLQELNNQLAELVVADIQVQTEQLDGAISKVNELSAILEELDGKIVRTTVITEERTVAARAAGGPVGVSAFSRLMSPVIRAGSGTIDDVPAMLKREEFVMNPKATRKYGMALMHRINAGKLDLSSVVQLASGGPPVPDLAQASAAPLPPVKTNVSTGSNTAFNQILNINGKSGILTPQIKDLSRRLGEQAAYEMRRKI